VEAPGSKGDYAIDLGQLAGETGRGVQCPKPLSRENKRKSLKRNRDGERGVLVKAVNGEKKTQRKRQWDLCTRVGGAPYPSTAPVIIT